MSSALTSMLYLFCFLYTRGYPHPDIGMRVTARDDKLEPMLRLSSGLL